MCLLIFAHQASEEFPLLVAANRDEFHDRPTRPSMFWPKHPGLLAGQDIRLGGTWMGCTRAGKFAAVTNFREPAQTAQAPRSRGELPLDFLLGQLKPEQYLEQVKKRSHEYAGFNLLLGDAQTLWYFSNSVSEDDQQPQQPRVLPPGIYGLSNAQLDTPWPKVELGKNRMQELLSHGNPIEHDAMLTLVSSSELVDINSLPKTGMNSAMEQLLSSQVVQSQHYGTRSSTTIWLDKAGSASWRELSFDPAGNTTLSQREDFRYR
jgi:uncharacterized protein with NRDE domain